MDLREGFNIQRVKCSEEKQPGLYIDIAYEYIHIYIYTYIHIYIICICMHIMVGRIIRQAEGSGYVGSVPAGELCWSSSWLPSALSAGEFEDT